MNVEIGKTYKDGWGSIHTIGGPTTVNPDWVYSVQGDWFRKADGRRITYPLIDPSKPNGRRRHEAAKTSTNWDLKVQIS